MPKETRMKYIDRYLAKLDKINAGLQAAGLQSTIGMLDSFAFQELMGTIIDEFENRLSELESDRDYADTKRRERAELT